MKRILIILIAIFLFTGCATTQMLRPETLPDFSPKKDTAILVIIRDYFIGNAIVFWNYLDTKFIGETKGNTYFVTEVTPGEHYVICSTENTAVALLNFEPGKRYFLREGVTMGLWRARTSGFSPMTSQEATKAIEDCTYLELDPNLSFPDMDPELYKTAIEEYHTGVKEDPEGYKTMVEYRGE